MTIDDELQNWARYVQVRRAQGHCRSIENRYRRKIKEGDTPTGWVDWRTTPPIPPLPPIDLFAAIAVEKIMHLVPEQHRDALEMCYVYRTPRTFACRLLAIRYADWEKFIGDARNMVRNLLQRGAKRGNFRPQFAAPDASETNQEPHGLPMLCGAETTTEPV